MVGGLNRIKDGADGCMFPLDLHVVLPEVEEVGNVEVLPFCLLEIVGEEGGFEIESGDCVEQHQSGPDEEGRKVPDCLGSSEGGSQEG